MRAETFNTAKLDWEIINCPNCDSSNYFMDIDAGQYSDEPAVTVYECKDCGTEEPPF